MKKSNLLLLAAFAILAVSLGMYNVALKNEYATGTYKDPYKNYKPLNLQGFQAIDINAANKVNVEVKPGKFQVWVHERSTDIVRVKLVGNRLQIDAAYPEEEGNDGSVIITCPSLAEIKTNAYFQVKGKQEQRKISSYSPPVKVEGFTLDSLQLRQDNASRIRLNKNKIGLLRSTTGISPGAASHLEIGSDNTIQQAYLTVRNKGKLRVESPKIARLQYDFGDSTEVTFSGSAMGMLKK
jgi:hypothetical protein